MSAINVGRVVGAGLLAGAVFNAVDIASQLVVADDMKAMVERLHLEPAVMDMTPANMLPWIIADFLSAMQKMG